MAEGVAEELKDYSWDDRYKWVSDEKKRGNDLFKTQKYEEAIEQYERAMMGLGFPKNQMDNEDLKK